MFGRVKIKEGISAWIKILLSEEDDYSTLKVGGEYSKKDVYPYGVVSIRGEQVITNRNNGVVGIDQVEDVISILYVSDFGMAIEVLAEIGEEASSIAEIIVDKIRDGNYTPVISEINNVKVYDSINISEPTPRKMGSFKVFSVVITLDIRVGKIKIKQGV